MSRPGSQLPPSAVLAAATAFAFAGAPLARAEPGSALSYTTDVRPLLSQNCFACHGPDEEERKGGLRLDVAGETDFDEVIARIISDDPDDRMPPPESNKTLDAAQIATIREWIGTGATYEPHWAFVPPAAPPIGHESHPVDYFIDRALERSGLTRSAQADPYTRLRRVTLDLIGLPPPQNRPIPSLQTHLMKPSLPSLTGCSLPPATASAGHAAGSTSPATQIPTATRKIATVASGRTATG